MFTPIQKKDPIDDSDVVRYQKIREAKLHFNALIEQYLKEKKMSIAEITKKDINYLGKKYKEQEREILIQQIMYFLETNFGKPLKRIKENHKCALFEEIDKDGWIKWNSEEWNSSSWEQWMIQVVEEANWWTSWGNEETNSSSSWELLSN